MGNYNSCCYNFLKDSTAKIMDSHGNLRKVKVPVKAAELMLEQPGYAVCSVQELKKCGRIVAMKAEDEILAGKVYMFVVLSRVHSKISEGEMRIIEFAACGKKSRSKKRRGAKVLPAVVVEAKENGDQSEEVIGLNGNDNSFSSCRAGNCKQWTPVLEPIKEEF